MDLRTYIEESEEAWMWIYGNDETEAVNMDHVVSMRLQGGPDSVMVVVTTVTEEEIVLQYCDSGGEARDVMKAILASANARGNIER
jgi:hypothetical protein